LALAASRMYQLHSPPAHACPQPVSARLPIAGITVHQGGT
jgi:hypothetical protein